MSCSGTSNQNTIIHTGDDAIIHVNFVDCAGVAIDVAGTTLAYSIHTAPGETALHTRISPSAIVIAGNGQSAMVFLTPTHTNYSDKRYFHKLVLTDGDGHVMTLLTGEIVFSQQATTCCDELTARIDNDLFVPGAVAGPSWMLDFSYAENARNFRIFLGR